MKKLDAFRFSLVFFFLVFFFLGIILRLSYWQIVRAQDLDTLGKRQSTEVISNPPQRGQILFQDAYPLATNHFSYLMYANPKTIESPGQYSRLLSSKIHEEESSISAQLEKDLFWVKITEGLTLDEKKEIEKMELKGVGFEMRASRFYPEASMSAHLVGFVGKDQYGGDKGYFGIEGYYDELLQGRGGASYIIRDALGNPILSDIREEEKIDGRTIRLTQDRTVQFIVEEKLKKGLESYQAEGGTVIVMNPKTGAVLAMASFPQFDPQKYYESNDYQNPAISELYEPGSTFKVLIMASGIDAGVVKPDTECTDCDKPVEIGEYSIKTWNNKYYPRTTMTEVIQHSDNTGMVFVARKLGIKKLVSYLEKFGIGQKTNIDLQGEATGVIRDENDWYPIDLATASFGQGISITPIQLLSGVNAIANDGIRMKPYVADKIIDEAGDVFETKPAQESKPIKSSTAKVMTAIMVNAVEKGESKWTKLKGYRVAGKTGTAQIPVAGHYDPSQTIASFVGFFPAEDPQISMLVLVNRPKTSIYGSETAAPIFFKIAEDVINYYKIAPSY